MSERPPLLGSSAKHYFLGDSPAVPTGAGARGLLLDSGVGPAFTMGGRLINLAPATGPNGHGDMTHGSRIASLCAEGAEAISLPGGSCGIAPAASIVSAVHRSFAPDRWLDIPALLRDRSLSADVIGLPWSAPETHWLAHVGRSQFSTVTAETGALIIAAVGHDGADSVRFPATCPFVLSVGVHNTDGFAAEYSGTDLANRKPELLVPDLAWLARLESGELSTIGGTSAAVAIVTGLGLLWCERLRSAGLAPSPDRLKAVLLAAAAPAVLPPFRILLAGAAFPHEMPLIGADCGRDSEFRAIAESGSVRLCVVSSTPKSMPQRWIFTPPLVSLHVRQGGREWRAQATGWCALDLDLAAGGFDFSVSIDGGSDGGSGSGVIVGLGAQALERRKGPPHSTKRSFTVVGISASQSAAACVLRDGHVEAAVQLERITRRKRDGQGFLRATEAIEYCLDAVGIRASEVDLFAFNCQPLLPGWVGLSQPTADAGFRVFDPFGERSRFVSHHLAHAFAAYAGSGFRHAAVLVCDGSGGCTLGADDLVLSGSELLSYLQHPAHVRPPVHVSSIYRFEGRNFRLLDRESAESFNIRCGATSIGEVYAAVSQYLFNDWQEGGKLMGLAAYGDADGAGPSLLEGGPDGRLRFRRNWQDRYCRTTGMNPLDPENRNLAARIQCDLETAILERVRFALDVTGERCLAYSGGIALNCAANSRILNESGAQSLFIFPASNDAGIAVGAAYAALAQQQCHPFQPTPWTVDFRGYPYSEVDFAAAIRAWRPWLRVCRYNARSIAERLAAGQIIGWFEGGSEFGLRALGHRSILADPRRRAIRDAINHDVKHREDFRPFAPVVPLERANEFFDITAPSPYMLLLAQIRPEFRSCLGAVSHENGTARVQTVSASDVPRLHSLLLEFGAITQMPVLLNTSLNVRGQPIVETPLEAVELLLSTQLDCLVLGDTIVEPESASLLDYTSFVALSPSARVICESSGQQPRSFIESSVQCDRFELPPSIFKLLTFADGSKTIQQLMQMTETEELSTSQLALLEALSAERLVLGRPGAQG